jgi:hypothetical protein
MHFHLTHACYMSGRNMFQLFELHIKQLRLCCECNVNFNISIRPSESHKTTQREKLQLGFQSPSMCRAQQPMRDMWKSFDEISP